MKASDHRTSGILLIIVLGLVSLQNWQPLAFALAPQNELSSSSSEADLFDYAVRAATQITSRSERETKLVLIASMCAEAGRFEQALLITEKLTWDSYRVDALKKIAIAFWHAGQNQKAEEMLARMKELKLPPDEAMAVTLKDKIGQSMLEVYLEMSQYAKALAVSKTFRDEMFRTHGLGLVLNAYFTREKGGLPAWLLDELHQTAAALQTKPPPKNSGAAVSPAQQRFEEEALAKSRRNSMRGVNASLAIVYAKAGEIKRAEQMARRVGPENDEDGAWYSISTESTLTLLAVYYATQGKVKDAFRLALSLKSEPQGRTWVALAEEFIKNGNPGLAQKALAQLLKLEQAEPRHLLYAFASAAPLYQQLGETEKSVRLLRMAFERSKADESPEMRANHLTFVAERAAESGLGELMSEALAAKNKLAAYDTVSVLGGVGQKAAQKKHVRVVDKILAEIEKPTNAHNGYQKVRALTRIAESLLAAGERQMAERALRQALVFNQTTPDNTRLRDLWWLAVMLARAERVDLLFELADSIRAPERPSLAEALAGLGIEFSKRGWKLDNRARQSIERLLAASVDARPPPLFSGEIP